MSTKPDASKDIELVPDAWPRFERFIKQLAKAGPQHKISSGTQSAGKKKPRIAKRKRPAAKSKS
jgi:hypothetical protein